MNTYNQLAFGELGNLKTLLPKKIKAMSYQDAQSYNQLGILPVLKKLFPNSRMLTVEEANNYQTQPDASIPSGKSDGNLIDPATKKVIVYAGGGLLLATALYFLLKD